MIWCGMNVLPIRILSRYLTPYLYRAKHFVNIFITDGLAPDDRPSENTVMTEKLDIFLVQVFLDSVNLYYLLLHFIGPDNVIQNANRNFVVLIECIELAMRYFVIFLPKWNESYYTDVGHCDCYSKRPWSLSYQYIPARGYYWPVRKDDFHQT